MSRSHQLADFQVAAVDHIIARLRDKRGSRRFLLADEVGLGKTIVARGVIDALAKRKGRPLRVIYICSNAEIAEQNRSKLVDGGGKSIGRATELALEAPQRNGRVELFAFTPGTSLAGGTGMAWERRLMLYLLRRLYGYNVHGQRWRAYFRCSAREDRWMSQTTWRSLVEQFKWKTSTQFQQALREELTGPGRRSALVQAIEAAVGNFASEERGHRASRSRLIGEYRGVLQRIALRSMEPDLVVLDEVQRFKTVIDEAENPHRISSELFRGDAPVLILSATPYRLLTTELEAQEGGARHHEDFFETLNFLFHRDKRTPRRVRENLTAFGANLGKTDLKAARDDELLDLKRNIESDLLKVVCRTERSWYFQNSNKVVAESGVSGKALPNRDELSEFFAIHRGLAQQLDGLGLVTDFWKSAPSLLTFMDGEYVLTKKLKKHRIQVPRLLVSRADDPSLPGRNLRLRRLVEHSLGPAASRPALWTRPLYTYHEDEVYGTEPQRKMLVFSGWRFVPKAVAVVISNAAAARLPGAKEETRQPLRLRKQLAFHTFDVCYPCWSLAGLVNPRSLASRRGIPTASEVLTAARRVIQQRLVELGVRIAKAGNVRLWEVVARLEAASGRHRMIDAALSEWRGPADEESNATEVHREQMREWLAYPNAEMRITESDLDQLALMAVGSPATCLLRSLLSVFSEEEVLEALPELVSLTFEQMRRYFNRPLNQQAIRKHHYRDRKRAKIRRGFTQRVLDYALDHHLQAVLDEHTYFLRHATARTDVSGVLAHYASIWSLGRGSKRTNEGRGPGDLVRLSRDTKVWPTHFALTFGEDGAAEAGPTDVGEQRMRRTEVREAFNSPFWPFVLATTSAGQEGLDFHLYCRDVFHWNLPSNPVDLEQREGRLNRRDCLAVRQSIVEDWPLSRVAAGVRNPWAVVFERLQADGSAQRYKHGLYPHWIYECRNAASTVGVLRHVAFFDASRDSKRYERLKTGLALYRLVFGQANQEHLLNDLEERLENVSPAERAQVQRRLSGYMLNLSPVGSAHAMRFANAEAALLLGAEDLAGLNALLDDVRSVLAKNPTELGKAANDIDRLVQAVSRAIVSRNIGSRSIRKAVTALAYLRNPYDRFFDQAAIGGFDDDIAVVRRASSVLG